MMHVGLLIRSISHTMWGLYGVPWSLFQGAQVDFILNSVHPTQLRGSPTLLPSTRVTTFKTFRKQDRILT